MDDAKPNEKKPKPESKEGEHKVSEKVQEDAAKERATEGGYD